MNKKIIKYLILFLIAVIIVVFIKLFTNIKFNLKTININTYENIIEKDEINYIYITSDKYNIQEFEDILKTIFKEKNKTLYKLDMTEQTNFDYIMNNDKIMLYFNSKPLFPILIITKGNEIISSVSYDNEETIIEKINRIEEL